MKQLIIAEHNHQEIAANTKSCVAAAQQLGEDISILVAAADCEALAEQAACIAGVHEVLYAEHDAYCNITAENLTELVINQSDHYDNILFPASTFGKNSLPRIAAKLSISPVTDVIEINAPDKFKRPIYAGNAIEEIAYSAPKKLLSIRTTAFSPIKETQQPCKITRIKAAAINTKSKVIKLDASMSERPELTSAKVVVSGGRALKSAENFKLIEALADKLDAAIGASRAAVDAGFVPNDLQVGQTGKVVAPELYIAVGISGAVQHIAGMKESKVIVAINKDEDAPIFQVADYGLVGDLFTLLPELISAL